MSKKTFLLLAIVAFVVIVGIIVIINRPKNSPSSADSDLLLVGKQQTNSVITPSETTKVYTDPSGFSFSYPDNLSLVNNELKDNNTYAQLQLTAKGVEGSLALKVADSKITNINEWVKTNKDATSPAPKEVKLGGLKALEIETTNKVLLGALDQGVLFVIEYPKGKDKDFWMKVYNKILLEFSFVPPTAEATTASESDTSSSDSVSFEGEEVVE